MIHHSLVLLMVYLVFISTIHAIAEDEDFDDMTAAIADSYAIVGGRSARKRLHKRGDKAQASTKLEPMILQFDFGPSRFVIQLQEHPNIIHESTIVRVHHENKGAVATKPVNGVAYIGERLVVIDKSLSDSKYGSNVTALLLLSEEPGISVLDYPFGRFYVDDSSTQPRITGGFVFNRQFIRVNEASHPVSRQLATKLHMKLAGSPSTDKKEPLVITAQNLADTGNFGTSRNTTRRYKCGHDNLDFNSKPEGATSFFAKLLTNHLTNGESKKLYARSESGCPSSEKVIYVGVVADCAYLEAFKMDAAQAQANIINDFNIVSAIYEESFNVILGIISVDLMMECSKDKSKAAFNRPCSQKMRMDERLNLFTAWRGSQSSDAGLYHLVSGCSDSDIVGIAWLNQVCQVKPYIDPNGDSVAGTSVSVFIKNQFAVMAHEIGHNFGAPHDCDLETCKSCSGADCKCCPCDNCDCKGKYVMNPESGGLNVKRFSPCTVQDICQKIPVLAPCLKEPGTFKTLTKAMCGDGVRDEGEECDCGGPEKCRGNPCCTEDCKLRKGAVCSDSNDRCCKDCKIVSASANQVCIPAKGLCQKQSVCNGVSRDCPTIQTVADGTECDAEEGRCASGLCTSRSQQCAAVGARLGLNKACPYEFGSCSIVCESGSGCVMLDATFINGTICGYNGKCYGGVCSEPAYRTFIMRNIVPLGIVAGALLLILVLVIIRSIVAACRARRQTNV